MIAMGEEQELRNEHWTDKCLASAREACVALRWGGAGLKTGRMPASVPKASMPRRQCLAPQCPAAWVGTITCLASTDFVRAGTVTYTCLAQDQCSWLLGKKSCPYMNVSAGRLPVPPSLARLMFHFTGRNLLGSPPCFTGSTPAPVPAPSPPSPWQIVITDAKGSEIAPKTTTDQASQWKLPAVEVLPANFAPLQVQAGVRPGCAAHAWRLRPPLLRHVGCCGRQWGLAPVTGALCTAPALRHKATRQVMPAGPREQVGWVETNVSRIPDITCRTGWKRRSTWGTVRQPSIVTPPAPHPPVHCKACTLWAPALAVPHSSGGAPAVSPPAPRPTQRPARFTEAIATCFLKTCTLL